MDAKLTLFSIFLFFNCGLSFGASVNSVKVSLSDNKFNDTKNVGLLNEQNIPKLNQSDVLTEMVLGEDKSVGDGSLGRTFGRPLKKMMSALIPLIFQIGAASTWAVVAALVGIKTLAVTLVILKLLLVAGAAKAGALLASKGHQQKPHGWEHQPPLQKEIHLHIHNGGQHTPHDEHIATWNRNEVQLVKPDKNLNMVIDPYSAGPQTISTPFGNYVRID